MQKLQLKAVLSIIVFQVLLSSCAEFKDVGKTIGHTASEVAEVIGQGFHDAATSIGKRTKEVVRSVVAKDEK